MPLCISRQELCPNLIGWDENVTAVWSNVSLGLIKSQLGSQNLLWNHTLSLGIDFLMSTRNNQFAIHPRCQKQGFVHTKTVQFISCRANTLHAIIIASSTLLALWLEGENKEGLTQLPFCTHCTPFFRTCLLPWHYCTSQRDLQTTHPPNRALLR